MLKNMGRGGGEGFGFSPNSGSANPLAAPGTVNPGVLRMNGEGGTPGGTLAMSPRPAVTPRFGAGLGNIAPRSRFGGFNPRSGGYGGSMAMAYE